MRSLLGCAIRGDCGTAPKIFLYLFRFLLFPGGKAEEEVEEEEEPLAALTGDQSVNEQKQHRAHDRHDPMRGVVVVPGEHPAQPRSYERAGNAEKHRDNATAGVAAWHE